MVQSKPIEQTASDRIEQPNVPPFFVVGCGRSGTTLLRNMLTAHPLLAIPVESLFMVDYLRASTDVPPERLKNLIVHDYEFREWAMPLTHTDLDGCRSAQEMMLRLHALYCKQQRKPYWGQKTPRFVRHGLLIKANFPNGRFINVIRDPRAVVNSLMTSDLHRSNPYYGSKRWVMDVQYGLELERQFPGDVLHIKYEDLVERPRSTLTTVCDFIGVDYDDAMLHEHSQNRSDFAPIFDQIHARTEGPIQSSRVNAWRKRLSERDIALIESITRDLMVEVGYQPDDLEAEIPARWVRYLKMQRYGSLLTQIIDRVFRWRRQFASYIWRKLRLGLFWRDLSQVNY